MTKKITQLDKTTVLGNRKEWFEMSQSGISKRVRPEHIDTWLKDNDLPAWASVVSAGYLDSIVSAGSREQDQRLHERIDILDPAGPASVSAASREQDQRLNELITLDSSNISAASLEGDRTLHDRIDNITVEFDDDRITDGTNNNRALVRSSTDSFTVSAGGNLVISAGDPGITYFDPTGKASILSEAEYYFSAYDASPLDPFGNACNPFISPENGVDGNEGTPAQWGNSNRCLNMTANQCDGTNLGTITKVEWRVKYLNFTYSNLDAYTYYGGAVSGSKVELPLNAGGAWSAYYDITDEANSPGSGNWTWADIQNLDIHFYSNNESFLYLYEAQIKVTYSTNPELREIQKIKETGTENYYLPDANTRSRLAYKTIDEGLEIGSGTYEDSWFGQANQSKIFVSKKDMNMYGIDPEGDLVIHSNNSIHISAGSSDSVGAIYFTGWSYWYADQIHVPYGLVEAGDSSLGNQGSLILHNNGTTGAARIRMGLDTPSTPLGATDYYYILTDYGDWKFGHGRSNWYGLILTKNRIQSYPQSYSSGPLNWDVWRWIDPISAGSPFGVLTEKVITPQVEFNYNEKYLHRRDATNLLTPQGKIFAGKEQATLDDLVISSTDDIHLSAGNVVIGNTLTDKANLTISKDEFNRGNLIVSTDNAFTVSAGGNLVISAGAPGVNLYDYGNSIKFRSYTPAGVGTQTSTQYLLNSYHISSTYNNPQNAIDGSTATYADKTGSGVLLLDENECDGTDLGTIDTVEIRYYHETFSSTHNMYAVYNGVDNGAARNINGDPNNTWLTLDITDDTNAPGSGNWTWADIQNMDVRFDANTGAPARVKAVQIQVTYTPTTPESIDTIWEMKGGVITEYIDGIVPYQAKSGGGITLLDSKGNESDVHYVSNTKFPGRRIDLGTRAKPGATIIDSPSNIVFKSDAGNQGQGGPLANRVAEYSAVVLSAGLPLIVENDAPQRVSMIVSAGSSSDLGSGLRIFNTIPNSNHTLTVGLPLGMGALGGNFVLHGGEGSVGGRMYLMAAGDATTTTQYHIYPNSDDLYIGANWDTDIITIDQSQDGIVNFTRNAGIGIGSSNRIFSGKDVAVQNDLVLRSTNDIYASAGSGLFYVPRALVLNKGIGNEPKSGIGNGYIDIWGGDSEGGGYIIQRIGTGVIGATAVNYNINIESTGDWIFGPNTDPNSMMYDESEGTWVFTGANGVEIQGPLQTSTIESPLQISNVDNQTADITVGRDAAVDNDLFFAVPSTNSIHLSAGGRQIRLATPVDVKSLQDGSVHIHGTWEALHKTTGDLEINLHGSDGGRFIVSSMYSGGEGGTRNVFIGDPDGASTLYYAGTEIFRTYQSGGENGFQLVYSGSTIDFFVSSNSFNIKNNTLGGDIILEGIKAGSGTPMRGFVFEPGQSASTGHVYIGDSKWRSRVRVNEVGTVGISGTLDVEGYGEIFRGKDIAVKNDLILSSTGNLHVSGGTSVLLHHNKSRVAYTGSQGMYIGNPTVGTPSNYIYIYQNTTAAYFYSLKEGANIILQGGYTGGEGGTRDVFTGDPDGASTLYYQGTGTLSTIANGANVTQTLTVGADESQEGSLYIYGGDPGGYNPGGELRIYLGGYYDDNDDYFRIWAENTAIQIGTDGDDFISYQTNDGSLNISPVGELFLSVPIGNRLSLSHGTGPRFEMTGDGFEFSQSYSGIAALDKLPKHTLRFSGDQGYQKHKGLLFVGSETGTADKFIIHGHHTMYVSGGQSINLSVSGGETFYSDPTSGAWVSDSDILPLTSGLDLGKNGKRWENVWGKLINGGDIGLENNWRLLESEKYEGYPVGFAIGNQGFVEGRIAETAIGKPIFAVTEDFIEYKGVRITKEKLEKLLELI